jgi:DNA-binding NtrC family response regulator
MEELTGDGGGPGRARRPKRILVAEPDYQRRIHAAQIAATLGMLVVLAADAEEASSIIGRQATRLDGVLVSLSGPGVAEVKQAIAAHRPQLPLIDWGAEAYSADRLTALLNGMD